MNVFSRASHRWRKNRKRGVSPIIATILLVAITVVLAAVLYVLISGLTKTGASTPYALEMTVSSANLNSGVSYYEQLTLAPTSGLATSMVTLSMLYENAPGPGVVAASGSCTFGATWTVGGNCVGTAAGQGWYAVLVSSGTVYGTYGLISGSPSWANLGTGVASSPISQGLTMWIVSEYNYNSYNGAFVLSAGGAGGASVSGTCAL